MKFRTTDDGEEKLFEFPMTVETDQGPDEIDQKYYRRMFLVDNISGRDNSEEDDILGSYVSKVEIYYSTHFKPENPIRMTMIYSPLRRSAYDNDNTVETEFEVRYHQ